MATAKPVDPGLGKGPCDRTMHSRVGQRAVCWCTAYSVEHTYVRHMLNPSFLVSSREAVIHGVQRSLEGAWVR